jgi:hypothetical protein
MSNIKVFTYRNFYFFPLHLLNTFLGLKMLFFSFFSFFFFQFVSGIGSLSAKVTFKPRFALRQ